jgi:hypothetical protein
LEIPRIPWDDRLLLSARRAAFALQRALQHRKVTLPVLQLRAFDARVKPVMQYAAQLWGPDHALSKGLDSPFQKVQLAFLRCVAGVGVGVSSHCLLAEFGQVPLQCVWLKMAVRFWQKLVATSNSFLVEMFHMDVRNGLAGVPGSWVGSMLRIFKALHVVLPEVLSSDSLRCLQLDVNGLVQGLKARIIDWPSHVMDPRVAPSSGLSLCRFRSWFYDGDSTDAGPARSLLRCTDISQSAFKTLIRFRQGCGDLAVNKLRMGQNKVHRCERLCKVPGCTGVEDERHAVFECVAHDGLRHSRVFTPLFDGCANGDMLCFFSKNSWPLLCDYVCAMEALRKSLL